VPHSSRVGSQITGCSNLYPLNAPQRVSEIWLPVFTVSCFTVNKRAQIGVSFASQGLLGSEVSLAGRAASPFAGFGACSKLGSR
jgi:hypothetical protein